MKGGTRSSTLAVQMTCVSPNSTSTEPAACFVNRRVNRTLRKRVRRATTGSLRAGHTDLLIRATADYTRLSFGMPAHRDTFGVECVTSDSIRGFIDDSQHDRLRARRRTARFRFAAVGNPLGQSSLSRSPSSACPTRFANSSFRCATWFESKLKRGKVDCTLRSPQRPTSAHLEINRPVLLHLLATLEQLQA